MPRPEFITNEDILRWSENIDNDPLVSKGLAQEPILREVMYAGLWLCESLDKLKCPHDIITRIQFTAGQYSFGRDPWEAHQKILELYNTNQLKFEPEPADIN